MEQNTIIQMEDDIEYWNNREKKLTNFKLSLSNFELPDEIEKEITFKISSEIDICETEKEQLIADLNLSLSVDYQNVLDEVNEMKADLEGKYQEYTKIES
jgi:hypothetical protein